MNDVFHFLTMRCFNDVSKIAKHRANDASNDVHRPPLPPWGGTNQSAPLVQLQYAIKWISWKIRYHPQHQHQNQHKQSFKSNAVPYPYFALDLIFTKSKIRKV